MLETEAILEVLQKCFSGSNAKTRRFTRDNLREIAETASEFSMAGPFSLKADAGAVANSYQYSAMTDVVEISMGEDGSVLIEGGRRYARKISGGDSGRICVTYAGTLPENLEPKRKRGNEYWF